MPVDLSAGIFYGDQMNQLEHKILALFSAKSKRSLTRREIADRLDLRGGERKLLTKVLQQLERNNRIAERKGRYRLSAVEQKLEGAFSLAE